MATSKGNTIKLLALVAVPLSALAYHAYRRYVQDAKDCALVERFQKNCDGLLEEQVAADHEVGTFVEGPDGLREVVVEAPAKKEAAASTVNPAVVLENEQHRVRNHYRVNNQFNFSQIIVNEAKNRFGCPQRNKANLLAVRKFLVDRMTAVNVRPTHMNRMLPLCIEMVFVPNDSEMAAERIAACWEATRGSSGYKRWYRWACNLVCGVRGAPRSNVA